MRCRLLLSIGLASGLAVGCNSGNPVAPSAPQSSGGGTGEALTVTVTADPAQLAVDSTAPARIQVTAKRADGTPPADGTEVRINTSLGSFGSDASGQPLMLVTRTLAAGAAEADLFAGAETGVATLLAQVGTSTGRLSVPIVTPSPKPVADFTFEVNDLTVLFTDASTGDPTTFAWDFGDGTTSELQSPSHDYGAASTYTVSLTVGNATGQSTKHKFVTVMAGAPLAASFTFEASGLSVLFTDTSAGDPTAWDWDFGDGAVSSVQNPGHTFPSAGTYGVMLKVSNDFGVTSRANRFVTVSLGQAPVADFQTQLDGLRVLFIDASNPQATSWSWSFGDCTLQPSGCTSTEQNPEHLYPQAGTYNVTLTATNAAGSSMKSTLVTVSPGDPPHADFDAQANGLKVVFTDRSTGQPTTWSWDFGDCPGNPECRSSDPNPFHIYSAPGTYTVILSVKNDAGSSQASKVITVSAAPEAKFCYQRDGLVVLFFDGSTHSPTTWAWDFGDCESQGATCKSTLQNPGHTYLANMTYAVSLKVTNGAGTSSTSKLVKIDGSIDPSQVCE